MYKLIMLHMSEALWAVERFLLELHFEKMFVYILNVI